MEIAGRDIEALVALALRLKSNGRLAGVFTFTELVTCVAAAAETCELVGSRISASVRRQHQGLTNIIWQDSGLATPLGSVCYGKHEAEASFAKLALPLIVKPTIGSGGYGMSILSSTEEMALSLDKIWAERAFAKRFVREEVVTGTSCDANGFFLSAGKRLSLRNRRPQFPAELCYQRSHNCGDSAYPRVASPTLRSSGDHDPLTRLFPRTLSRATRF